MLNILGRCRKRRAASRAFSVGLFQPGFFNESTRQNCAENTRELPGPRYTTGGSDLGVFEPFRLRRPVVLESAVLLAGPLHAEAEGRKRQRLGKGRNQRQSEQRLDARPVKIGRAAGRGGGE